MPMPRSLMEYLNRDLILRVVLLAVSAVLALIFANWAASLYEVWQLNTGALVPDRWTGLLGANQVTRRVHLVSLLGVAAFAGASLSCLVFFVDRLLRLGWALFNELLRR